METNQPIVNIIRLRSSWRAYKDQLIEPEKLAKLRKFMGSLSTGPFGGHARFELVEFSNIDPNEVKKLGTYGIIKGARYFIVGIKSSGPMDFEDYGYLFEQIILLATELGLGTVWLGSTFKRPEFTSQVQIKKNESVPAVSPVGYVVDKRRWLDSIMRWAIKASTRKPWETFFFSGNFNTPFPSETAGLFREPLEMVRLGPSAHNGQPWRVVKDPAANNFHFYGQHSLKGDENRPLPGFNRIDMGIAMCHFDLTAQELRLPGKWIVQDPKIIPLPPKTQYIASWTQE